ncbi:penicillin-binding protein [Streptomyces sp. SID4919]|uniref:transglycosylase domain-containing protein n=1 Tax=unclassified Streptomyces TaxID=2593676 RepID=UPI000823ABEB|nr:MULTISPECIES: transglycosylase domain-containing protein [unclassified Streptomyces]MYY11190.1 penicillin-binding protein [Streptomyces sp. SID4919]SCK16361.1 Membrane carboxypeptidase (penicillin-binding protein) [Streptomyces sp. AmelKG-E11A]
MGRAEERRARQRAGRRTRRGRPARGGRTGIRRFLTWRKLLGTFFGFVLLGMAAFVVLYLVVDVPEGNAQAKKQSNVYKYRDGTILARTGEVNREIVDLEQVPQDVQRTFVAIENKSFYNDKGVDLKGTARGVLNTLSGKGKQGGSTITQQYVKNYYLTQEQTVTRKLNELVISLKVDRERSKEYILAGYINTSYYGRGAHGIQAAAQAYYRVDAKDLTVAQGAYLASLLQAPSSYDWATASKRGKELVSFRWNKTLDNMVEKGWLDAAEREKQKFPVPKEPRPAPGQSGQTGYLVQAADAELEKRFVAEGLSQSQAESQVQAGGWTLTLNIDKKKQELLEKAVKKQLTSKLDPKKRPVDGDVQAGAASVDPKSGAVVAMYGGVDYFKHFTNNATRRDYQPASTFKPLIYAAALEKDAETQDGDPITANTVYDGDSKRPVVGSDIGFAPPNEDDVDYGDVTVQKAMNKSVNSVFAQMGVDVGMPEVMRMAGVLGMDVKGLEAVPAQTLGTMGASPLEMAGVYATLDNHGKKVTPAVLKSATHKDRTVDLPDPVGGQVVKRTTADAVTSVLTGVVDDGTGSAVRDPDQDVAGKTGTSDENRSAWFTGYTPDLVTSVGLFGEVPKDREDKNGKKVARGSQTTLKGATGGGRISGGGFPARIWAEYTFGAIGKPSEFDLDIEQEQAFSPPAEPSETPSSQPPTTLPPSRTQEEEEPDTEPSQEPEEPARSSSSAPPTSPSTDPGTEPEEPGGESPGTPSTTTSPPPTTSQSPEEPAEPGTAADEG